MLWLVQGSSVMDSGAAAVVECLKTQRLPYLNVRTHPNSDLIFAEDSNGSEASKLTAPLELADDQPIITMGSYALAKAALKCNLKPGAFINDNFTFAAWLAGWGEEYLLNGQAIEGPLLDLVVPDIWSTLFARPSEDTKLFTGEVFERANFLFWRERIVDTHNEPDFDRFTSIIVAPVQPIDCEYRLFVVNGEVITGSLYRLRGQTCYSPYIDSAVTNFVKQMLTVWQPHRAFVLDVALSEGQPKIIEVNNINSSRFYAADLPLLVKALDAMPY